MRYKKFMPLLAALAIGCAMFGVRFSMPRNYPALMPMQKSLSCKYYNETEFMLSLKNVAKHGIPEGAAIRGGIVPHHLLAGRMIADFFGTVSKSNPDVVIVVGPNHNGEGVKMVHTAPQDWNTPFGVLEADEEVIDLLLESNMAVENFDLMENEHSVSSLVPYVKYFFPDSKIVPLLLSGTDKISAAASLGRILGEAVKGRHGLIIASVDFSHYLPAERADEMDEITKTALLARDIQRIRTMDNDHMDSPVSVITLIAAMNEIGAKNQQILAHDNSSRITGSGFDCTTSYFTVIYW